MLRNGLFLARVLLSNLKRLSFPYKISLAVTYQCNSRCKTCNIWQREPANELSLTEIETFVARNDSLSFIALTGGEIFLREDIHSILIAILDNYPHLAVLQFPTNGLLTSRIENTIRAIPPTQRSIIAVTVALDGPPSVHDRIRGVTGSWERSLDTFKALRGLGIKAFFGTTISTYNQGLFSTTIRSVQKRLPGVTASDFHVNIAHVSGFFYDNEDMPLLSPETVKKDLKEYAQLRSSYKSLAPLVERKYAILGQEFLTTSRSPLVCQALGASCFIDPYGTVYPCISYGRAVGSIRDSGYRLGPIWRSTDTIKLRAEIRRQKCPQCWTPCEAFQAMAGSLLDKRLWTQ